MNEIEKIKYAKTFIDKLANGIDPTNDLPAAEDDIINNKRLIRCFFYVSDILRRVIENECTTRPRQKIKDSFNITLEQIAQYPFSEEPIPVSKIAQRINTLIDKTQTKQLSYRQLTRWLLSVGALTEYNATNGKLQKYPTELGKQLGIFIETRFGRNGEYQVVLYNKEAQSFILGNIKKIISFDIN